MVERIAVNDDVPGSSPGPGATMGRYTVKETVQTVNLAL